MSEERGMKKSVNKDKISINDYIGFPQMSDVKFSMHALHTSWKLANMPLRELYQHLRMSFKVAYQYFLLITAFP